MIHSVLDTAFFQDVSIEDKQEVLSMCTERRYRKNQVIFHQGDLANEMYIVKSGSLKIYREDFHRQIVFGHQFAGETIGELEVIHYDNRRLASVATLEDSVLWMIQKTDVDRLTQRYPIILRKMFYVVSERLHQADRKLEYLAFLDARYRVIHLLLDLHANFGKPTERGEVIDWKMTQQHFADMIGVSRESAARVLTELDKERIIHIEKRTITILNLSELVSLSKQVPSSDNHRTWHSIHKYDTSLS